MTELIWPDNHIRVSHAQSIIDRLLQGGAIHKDDSVEFKKFRINLEGEVTKAQTSGRASSFNNSDTINKIIRKKVPFVQQRWAVERTKKMMAMNPDNFEPEPQFSEFLTFLRSQNLIRDENSLISGEKDSENKKTKNNPRVMKIDTVSSSKAADAGGAKGGGGGGGGGGGKRRGKGGAKANNTTKSANTPLPQDNTLSPPTNNNKEAAIAVTNSHPDNWRNYYQGNRGGGMNNSNGPSQTFGFANRQNNNANPQSNNQGPNNSNTNAATTNNAAGNWSCPCCMKSKYHVLKDCKKFVVLTQPERFSVLKANGMCNKCLERGHMARDCTSEVGCDLCPGKRHHTLMHREFNNQKTDNNQKGNKSDDSTDKSENND